jgi:hypothetical protein
MMLENIQYIVDLYRSEFLNIISHIKSTKVRVVEFHIDSQTFYVDMNNIVYEPVVNNSRVIGNPCGYLKDKTIYLY